MTIDLISPGERSKSGVRLDRPRDNRQTEKIKSLLIHFQFCFLYIASAKQFYMALGLQ